MPKSYHEPHGDDSFADHPQAWVPLELTPDEKIVWVGRPHSRLDFAMKELVVGTMGLGFVPFTILWMTTVVLGGSNDGDRGHVVSGLAWPNYVIATFAGLFMLPSGLTMLTAPVRAWIRAPKTAYVLTCRRAIVCEPTLFGGVTVREFSARALGGMRCLEQGDGTGDLILGSRETMARWLTQPDGFLAVGEVRAVESLVRKTLGSSGPPLRAESRAS